MLGDTFLSILVVCWMDEVASGVGRKGRKEGRKEERRGKKWSGGDAGSVDGEQSGDQSHKSVVQKHGQGKDSKWSKLHAACNMQYAIISSSQYPQELNGKKLSL